jgi:P-type Mg2+ transporter
VDDELVKAPQRWNPADIGRFMLFFGPVSSVFDIATYLVMWFVFGANTVQQQTLFQSGWFIEGLMTQTLVVHMIRTRRIPFIQSRPGTPLLVATCLIMIIGIAIPMGPIAHYFKLQALPWTYFPVLAGILLGYMVLTQAMKYYYDRRFGWQ